MCAILRRCSLLTKKAALAALAPIDSGFSGPRRTIAVSTQEAYPKHRRVVKKPPAFAEGLSYSKKSND